MKGGKGQVSEDVAWRWRRGGTRRKGRRKGEETCFEEKELRGSVKWQARNGEQVIGRQVEKE